MGVCPAAFDPDDRGSPAKKVGTTRNVQRASMDHKCVIVMVRSGTPWRYLPDSFPPWHTVYGQMQRWIESGVFEDIADDLRKVVREAAGKKPEPTAAIIDSQTLRSTPESGDRAGYDAGASGLARARKSRAVKCISRSIRWAICLPCA